MVKRALALSAAILIIVVVIVSQLPEKVRFDTPLSELKERYKIRKRPSVVHANFQELRKNFSRPQDVTAACIGCHNGRHTEVMATSHWRWEREEYIVGKGIRTVGKKNTLNNFCIGISGNETTCNSCHIGYGWGDRTFNFSDSLNVDCLGCHDHSGTYVKTVGLSGYPDPSVNLALVAQSVGRPIRENCGVCHFNSGGGNNVKHGDLETALLEATRDVDVHMASDGGDLHCVDCHRAENHQMLGKMYTLSSMNRNRSTCEQCHGSLPHEEEIINEHTMKVACQTCHIPRYAKVNPVKTTWDWSTAGRLRNGEPYEERDSTGVITYTSKKGSFTWGRNLIPEYFWFNGTASHYLLGDTLSGIEPLPMNPLQGSYNDPDAKIMPVRVHRSNQIYDTKYRYLIQPKTVSTKHGDGGFWKEFNWPRAAEEGMKEVGLPYSGEYGFVKTEMYLPLNHMVSPKSETVKCEECHTRDRSRIASITDCYLPGRDHNTLVETFGISLIVLSLIGTLGHAATRIVITKRTRMEPRQ
jgi:octaheme c-type cytochrome (tetrathionate reductase family)